MSQIWYCRTCKQYFIPEEVITPEGTFPNAMHCNKTDVFSLNQSEVLWYLNRLLDMQKAVAKIREVFSF